MEQPEPREQWGAPVLFGCECCGQLGDGGWLCGSGNLMEFE